MFIVNRKAGTDKKEKFPEQVSNILDGSLFSHEIVTTGYRGHAVDLAAAAARAGTEVIAVVGGDGSVNEAARGLLGTDATLAIIPKGSGNGLARALGIPLDTRGALELINRFHPKRIDVGFANERLFLSNAGVGFDTVIATLFEGSAGRGLLNYARFVMRSFRSYRPGAYLLKTDDNEYREQAFFITAANGNQFGYGFRIAPGALTDDGLLDVCIMKPLKWWQLPGVSLRTLTGTLPRSHYATYVSTRTLTLSAEDTIRWMQVDGDTVPVEQGKVVIALRPKALQVLVP